MNEDETALPVRPPEATRDEHESEFTPILRSLYASVPSILAAAFVDVEGECIDYVSSLDPFEAKIAGAQMQVLMNAVRDSPAFNAGGEPFALEIATDTHEYWGRRVSDEYTLSLLMMPDVDRIQLRQLVRNACTQFRVEAGLPEAPWDIPPPALRVSVRPAVAWAYAPSALWIDGDRVDVTAVLGHWREEREGRDSPVAALLCFRVRTSTGQEHTLVHQVPEDRWSIRNA